MYTLMGQRRERCGCVYTAGVSFIPLILRRHPRDRRLLDPGCPDSPAAPKEGNDPMTDPAHQQFPPQPQPKKNRGCLWAALIVTGAFLLFGFVGCMAVVVGVSGDSDSPGAEAAKESEEGGSGGGEEGGEGEKKTAAVGDTTEDGSFAFTVTGVEENVESIGGDFMEETPQGQYVIVSVNVENIGTEAQMFNGSDQKLFDGAGIEYSNDSEAEISLEESESFLEDINPGNKVEAKIVFDIPQDVTPATIELHDSAFSDGVAVTL